ncbi:MAG: hypothetical protein HY692_06305 [Cyanobacteria bacterium NC_groundwater_1444_Ag_S-0.65um_54_12]|nr:hypothetical protein [Cyanobacteria bacterium NC_groundwater_1444_Ag_S-0.65um_54_12]
MVDRRTFWTKVLQDLGLIVLRTLNAYVAGLQEVNPLVQEPARTLERPPGALPEPEFLRRCTRCGDCSRFCHFAALRPDPDGLPWLWDPASHPCYRCEGFPCIAACSTGALSFRDRLLR